MKKLLLSAILITAFAFTDKQVTMSKEDWVIYNRNVNRLILFAGRKGFENDEVQSTRDTVSYYQIYFQKQLSDSTKK
jgi:hypothetical protein